MKQHISEKMGVPMSTVPYAERLSEILYEAFGQFMPHVDSLIKDPDSDLSTSGRLGTKEIGDLRTEDFPIDMILFELNIKSLRPGVYMPTPIIVEAGFYQNTAKMTSKGYQFQLMFNITIIYEALEFIKNGKVMPGLHKEIQAVAQHELTHAYEDYMRNIKKKGSVMTSNDYLYDLTSKGMTKRPVPRIIAGFLYLIYYSSSYEINARVSETYIHTKNLSSKEKLEYIKQSDVWKYMEEMQKFDANKFYDIILKEAGNEEDADNYIKYLSKQFRAGSDYLVKYMENKKDLSPEEKSAFEKTLKGHSNVLSRLERTTPIGFLNYWQKKFNYTSNDLKKRLMRLVAL
jgi:hypothetical protein